MNKYLKNISPYKLLAIFLSLILLSFSGFIFFSQINDKSDLVSAKVTEILELEDNQGLIYQNFLIRLTLENITINIKIPVNLPEVRALEKGDTIYLQEVGDAENVDEYLYTSTDRTLEFGAILVGFLAIILMVVGFKYTQDLFPAVTFLVLLVSGVFSLSTEVRFVFLSILGFMVIFTFISMVWYFEDLFLGILSGFMIGVSLLFSVLLHSILINFTKTTQPVNFSDLFGTNSVINDLDQAKLMVIMIFTYSLLVYVFKVLISKSLGYRKGLKKVTKEKLIKFTVDTIQAKVGQLLNLIFFLALGLNFLGLISEDYSVYKYIWNNSFFLSVVIDGVVAGITLIVGGYIMALITGIYLATNTQHSKAQK
jgi:hypothetical protein